MLLGSAYTVNSVTVRHTGKTPACESSPEAGLPLPATLGVALLTVSFRGMLLQFRPKLTGQVGAGEEENRGSPADESWAVAAAQHSLTPPPCPPGAGRLPAGILFSHRARVCARLSRSHAAASLRLFSRWPYPHRCSSRCKQSRRRAGNAAPRPTRNPAEPVQAQIPDRHTHHGV